MNAAEVDPRRGSNSDDWVTESAAQAFARLPHFGQRFFSTLFTEFPTLADGAQFLRWSAQRDDAYAILTWPGGAIGIQVDRDMEYIIVWGTGGQAEYGNWGDDQVPPALDHVRRLISGDEN